MRRAPTGAQGQPPEGSVIEKRKITDDEARPGSRLAGHRRRRVRPRTVPPRTRRWNWNTARAARSPTSPTTTSRSRAGEVDRGAPQRVPGLLHAARQARGGSRGVLGGPQVAATGCALRAPRCVWRDRPPSGRHVVLLHTFAPICSDRANSRGDPFPPENAAAPGVRFTRASRAQTRSRVIARQTTADSPQQSAVLR